MAIFYVYFEEEGHLHKLCFFVKNYMLLFLVIVIIIKYMFFQVKVNKIQIFLIIFISELNKLL